MKTVTIEELKFILLAEKARFQYRKRDGTLREAYGTLQFAFIPEDMQPPDTSTLFECKNLRYFDLEKGGWRSLSIDIKEVIVL